MLIVRAGGPAEIPVIVNADPIWNDCSCSSQLLSCGDPGHDTQKHTMIQKDKNTALQHRTTYCTPSCCRRGTKISYSSSSSHASQLSLVTHDTNPLAIKDYIIALQTTHDVLLRQQMQYVTYCTTYCRRRRTSSSIRSSVVLIWDAIMPSWPECVGDCGAAVCSKYFPKDNHCSYSSSSSHTALGIAGELPTRPRPPTQPRNRWTAFYPSSSSHTAPGIASYSSSSSHASQESLESFLAG